MWPKPSLRAPLCGGGRRHEVDCEALATGVVRALEVVWHAVPADVGSPKKHSSIEKRQYALREFRRLVRVALPQLQVSAPFLSPVGIQVNNEVDAPLHAADRVDRVVQVEFEAAMCRMVMQAGAVHMRVRLEVLDACDLSQARDGVGRLQRAPGHLEALVQRLNAVGGQFALDGIVVDVPTEGLPLFSVGFARLDREFVFQSVGQLGIKKVVDNYVWKRLRLRELRL